MTAVRVAKITEAVLAGLGGTASAVSTIEPWVQIVAGFFPGAASVVAALQIAEPIVLKIANIAPAAAAAIEAGMPVVEAIDNSPGLLPALKELYATIANGDPIMKKMEGKIDPSEVTDHQAMELAGPVLLGRPWTKDERQRWWDGQNARN